MRRIRHRGWSRGAGVRVVKIDEGLAFVVLAYPLRKFGDASTAGPFGRRAPNYLVRQRIRDDISDCKVTVRPT